MAAEKSERKLSKTAQARKDGKQKPVFYTRSTDKGQQVALWVNTVETKGAPQLDGKIGDLAVALWIRKSSETGNFIAVFKANAGKDGQHERLGSANVIVNKNGMPRLAINFDGGTDTIWARVSKDISDEDLVQYGLKLDILKTRREDAAAHKAAGGAEVEAKKEPAKKVETPEPAPAATKVPAKAAAGEKKKKAAK